MNSIQMVPQASRRFALRSQTKAACLLYTCFKFNHEQIVTLVINSAPRYRISL